MVHDLFWRSKVRPWDVETLGLRGGSCKLLATGGPGRSGRGESASDHSSFSGQLEDRQGSHSGRAGQNGQVIKGQDVEATGRSDRETRFVTVPFCSERGIDIFDTKATHGPASFLFARREASEFLRIASLRFDASPKLY